MINLWFYKHIFSYSGCCSVASTAVQQLQSFISTCICLAPANGCEESLTKGNCMSHSFLWSNLSTTRPPMGSTGPVHAWGITGACREVSTLSWSIFRWKNWSLPMPCLFRSQKLGSPNVAIRGTLLQSFQIETLRHGPIIVTR